MAPSFVAASGRTVWIASSLSHSAELAGETWTAMGSSDGATHAGAGERTTNRYAWGALRYEPTARRWQIGSAVREYFPEQDAFVASLGFDTDDGFLWEPIDLGWAPPRAASAEAAVLPRRCCHGTRCSEAPPNGALSPRCDPCCGWTAG